MSDAEIDYVSPQAAELYEDWFVPANFERWAPLLSDAAALSPNEVVLDVGCGTGALTREAARRLGAGGRVIGLDRSANMLAVARRKTPDIDWHHGLAEALPFAAQSFDVAMSQLAFMFFDNKVRALEEMYRVLRPGGRLCIAICGDLDLSPGYSSMAQLVKELFDGSVVDQYHAPFVLGQPEVVRSIFGEARIALTDLQRVTSIVCYDSVEAWVHTDFKGWTLSELMDEDMYQTLLREASSRLGHLTKEDGRVEFEMAAHFALAAKDF